MLTPVDSTARAYPYLGYRDASAALSWLEQVGFTTLGRRDGTDGAVLHAEVRYGEVVLILFSADPGAPAREPVGAGDGLYLCLPTPAAVDEWFTRAISSGGRAVLVPHDIERGGRRARVFDPEGKEWSVGTYRPGG
ncbi:VOC family protein [Crossiella cryophila]|uniref:Putative glyoxalase superfamily protein PhnB n=1 Tax=Crossiella cryophila TaxID=43355 RepID=A0A7W7CFB9_9PSEU|nr:VOC family protein [Crossiella cryophila]MBB4680129.1 putative glyoxalase superfamily protein PhnB [Crossiella cryophila]